MPKTLREILENLLLKACINCKGDSDDKEIIDQAISEIQGLVPEEMKWDIGYQNQDLSDAEQRGFNSAIKKVKERMR